MYPELIVMRPSSGNTGRHEDVLRSLADFSKQHRAARWVGTFASFVETVFPGDPRGIARTSHQYIWDNVFLELSCFFYDPVDVGNLISGSSAFSKTSLNIRKFTVHILLKPGLENFEHYFTSV